MEPGLRDREYTVDINRGGGELVAAMEPGLRDREYAQGGPVEVDDQWAAMEPGLRDREYTGRGAGACPAPASCNGARS